MTEHGHWSPPNRGLADPLRAIPSTGAYGAGQQTCHAQVVRPEAGESTSRRRSGGADPTIEDQSHRRNVLLGSDRYGPAGQVQVRRAFADPTASGKSMRRMPSAFGPQDSFRGGEMDGTR
ncbi:hypothetical protein ACIGXM_14105 [Kitasatospora sp. NPDC052896]|uniref:hypothetical protein n=1 Tax=Kitasatospora sp. NPDC052896 TaxID=3364061 RepID=UPI0037C9FAED